MRLERQSFKSDRLYVTLEDLKEIGIKGGLSTSSLDVIVEDSADQVHKAIAQYRIQDKKFPRHIFLPVEMNTKLRGAVSSHQFGHCEVKEGTITILAGYKVHFYDGDEILFGHEVIK